jgi:hypothetical protein
VTVIEGWPKLFAKVLNAYLREHAGCRPGMALETVIYDGNPYMVAVLRHVCPQDLDPDPKMYIDAAKWMAERNDDDA